MNEGRHSTRSGMRTVIIGLSLAIIAGCSQTPWRTVSLTDAGFSVSMPGTPKVDQESTDFDFGRLTWTKYSVSQGETSFAVSFVDYPDVIMSNLTSDRIFASGVERVMAVHPSARKIKDSRDFMQGFPCQDFVFEDPAIASRTIGRQVLAGRRLFLVQVNVPSKHATDADLSRFMESFRLIGMAGRPGVPSFKLADVLPVGRCDVELMTMEYTERAKELTLKFQAAVATNRDWLMEHIKASKPGEPLEYDPRLGLTREEYAEYLKESENHHLASTGTFATCTFQRSGNELSLDVGDKDSPLSKIRLNVVSGELIASVGMIGQPLWQSSDDPNIPIGAYDAYCWEYDKTDLNAFSGGTVKLNIYRLRKTGKILWRFEDSEMVHKEMTRSFSVLFQYSPPATSGRPAR